MKPETLRDLVLWFVVLGLSLARPVSADSLPPCWRGQGDSTFQEWNFTTNSNPAAPETSLNTNGTALAAIAKAPAGAGWLNGLFLFGTNQGVWDLGGAGSMSLSVPNSVKPPGYWKLVSVQVYQFRDGGIYNRFAAVNVPGATLLGTNTAVATTNVVGPGLTVTWVVHQSLWLIDPSPAVESIVITAPPNGAAIDRVIVDTISQNSDAGDVSPPCWRGNAASTFQNWSFHNNSSSPAPEQSLSPGTPAAVVTTGPFTFGWQGFDPALGCREGFWDLGSFGTVQLAIPNHAASPAAYTYLRLQISQFQDNLLYNQLAGISISPAASLVARSQQDTEFTVTGLWTVDKSLWRIPVAALSETITITGGPNGSLIDQVVVDTVNLEIPCPGDIAVSADVGQCFASGVTWSLPVADACLIQSVTCTTNGVAVSQPASFPVGVTPVTCVVVDAENQSRTCSFNVTVLDTQPPVIAVCPPAQSAAAGANCSALVPDFTIGLGAVDCSGPLAITQVPAPGSVVGTGTHPITITVTDTANNSAACSTTFSVTDSTPPDINIGQSFGNGEVTIECGLSWGFTVPILSDNCDLPGVITLNIFSTVTNAIVCGNSFTATRIWQALDSSGNTSYATQIVHQVDHTAPLITSCPANLTVACLSAVPPADVLLVTATDTCDGGFGVYPPVPVTIVHVGDVTNGFNPAVITRTYRATDSCSNSAVCTQTITVHDTELPQFVCPSALTNSTDAGQCSAALILPPLAATDNCGVLSVTSNAPAVFPSGSTLVTWTVVDVNDNTNTCAQLVVVRDMEPPVIATCPSPSTANAETNCLAAVPDFTAGLVVGDNCTQVANLLISQSPAVGSMVGLGAHTVTLTVTDASSNSVMCATSFTVTDATAPIIVTCAPALSSNANAVCQSVVPDFTSAVVAWDCNGPLTFVQIPPAGTTVGLGTHPITLVVKDAANNSATCATSFTVADMTAPEIVSCPPPQGVNADPVTCQAPLPDLTVLLAATDCNGPLTLVQSPPPGTMVGSGLTSITLTVRDAANNSAACVVDFTVTPVADLAVSVSAAPTVVIVGQPITYSVTVTNLSGCVASNVVISNFLSAGQVVLAVTNLGLGNMSALPAPGAVAWWAAENDAEDNAGANDGTVSGGVAYAPGQVGQAFSFDGLTGVVTVPDAPALRPASLTIEGWVKIQDPNGVHVIASKPRGSGMEESFSLWISSGTLHAAISDAGGSGAFLSYPDFPTRSLFVATDIVNLPSLAAKLKVPVDPVSTFLNDLLSPQTLNLLALYSGGADPMLARAIVADFNTIIESGAIYDGPRFAGVTLAPETAYLLGRNPVGSDLVRLNRLLIRDAYSGEIASVLFPQLNLWHHVAYTFDDVTKVQALFVNGELVDIGTVNKTIAYDASPLLIGAGNSNGNAGFFFQGLVDELAIYDRALSGIEVEAIHNAGANGKRAGSSVVSLGELNPGSSVSLVLTAVPVECPSVSLQATVTSTTIDPVAVNNQSSASVAVQDHAPGTVALSIQRVSINNNFVRLSWPLTCAPYVLEGTPSLDEPILWTPSMLPTQTIDGRRSTVIHADDLHHFFRLMLP